MFKKKGFTKSLGRGCDNDLVNLFIVFFRLNQFNLTNPNRNLFHFKSDYKN